MDSPDLDKVAYDVHIIQEELNELNHTVYGGKRDQNGQGLASRQKSLVMNLDTLASDMATFQTETREDFNSVRSTLAVLRERIRMIQWFVISLVIMGGVPTILSIIYVMRLLFGL